MAIGAGRARIARQLLIESLTLAIAGGGVGLLVAAVGLRLIARFQLPGGIEIESLDLGLSRMALIYTASVASLTGVVFGLAPAWRAARTDVLGSLREQSRSATGRIGLRSTLVAIQVALSLALLAGTGLFLQSLAHSLRMPLGFRVDGVATASVNLGSARYDAARANAFYDEAIDRVHALPGVTAAAWTSLVPTNGAHVMTPRLKATRHALTKTSSSTSRPSGPSTSDGRHSPVARSQIYHRRLHLASRRGHHQ